MILDMEERKLALLEAKNRRELYLRDGIDGDRIEAECATLRALSPTTAPTPSQPRPRRSVPQVGETIAGSTVKQALGLQGTRGHCFEVTCGGCGKLQVRSAGNLNAAQRRGYVILCPDCIAERAGTPISRAAIFRERARENGVVYTWGETEWLLKQVRDDLIAAFGDVVEELPPCPLELAAGYPWSHGERRQDAADIVRWLSDERHEREESQRYHDEQMALWERQRRGQHAIALLQSIEKGDARAMFDVLAATKKIA